MQQGVGALLDNSEEPITLRLVQDNAPAHAAKSTRAELSERLIIVEDWPPFSPDLNPIETCWCWMKDYQDKKWGDEFCSLDAERMRITECWEQAVTEEKLEALIRDMPVRCAEVIAVNGGPTRF